jgi:hypothetical protein
VPSPWIAETTIGSEAEAGEFTGNLIAHAFRLGLVRNQQDGPARAPQDRDHVVVER